MARHHPHERTPRTSVGMLPATVDVAGGMARDTGRRQQLPGDTTPLGYAAGWDKAAVDRRSHYQVSVCLLLPFFVRVRPPLSTGASQSACNGPHARLDGGVALHGYACP